MCSTNFHSCQNGCLECWSHQHTMGSHLGPNETQPTLAKETNSPVSMPWKPIIQCKVLRCLWMCGPLWSYPSPWNTGSMCTITVNLSEKNRLQVAREQIKHIQFRTIQNVVLSHHSHASRMVCQLQVRFSQVLWTEGEFHSAHLGPCLSWSLCWVRTLSATSTQPLQRFIAARSRGKGSKAAPNWTDKLQRQGMEIHQLQQLCQHCNVSHATHWMESRVEQAKAKTLPGKLGHNTLVLDKQKDVLYSSSVTEFRLAKKKCRWPAKPRSPLCWGPWDQKCWKRFAAWDLPQTLRRFYEVLI